MDHGTILLGICGSAAFVWALAWWDIQRRRGDDQEHYRKLTQMDAEIANGVKAGAEHLQKLYLRVDALEKNPATMQATRERMDTLEKAMANLVAQVTAEIEDIRRRNTTMLTRVNARGVGTRPNG